MKFNFLFAVLICLLNSSIAYSAEDFDKRQIYLLPAPIGIGAIEAWNIPGGDGKNVKIIDIEVGYNNNHKDLNLFYTGFNSNLNTNHATAVLGILGALKNGIGPTGIAYNSKLGFLGFDQGMKDVVDDEYIDSLVEKIHKAENILNKGDVLILEQEMLGPDDKYIAVEFWDEIFYALKSITNKGIHCVEASGNGGTNLDDPIYQNKFNLKFRDSGCVIVGAGEAGTNIPYAFSNYGTRVDAQGHGGNVFTLGYGDSSEELNFELTSIFNGTSSAAPIVAGAIALVSSIAKEKNVDVSTSNMRDALRNTGSSPQQRSKVHIGNLPNIQEMILYLNL